MSSLAMNQVSNLFQNLNQKNNKDRKESKSKNSSLIISYYNIAVQQEYLKRNKDSNVSYLWCENLAKGDLNSKESKQIIKKLNNVSIN